MHDNGSRARVVIDGVDCMAQEVSPFDSDRCSHKMKTSAQRWQVASCIQTGWPVDVDGPYKAGPWTDIRIFRNRLMHMLDDGEYIVGDRGYQDGFQFCITKNCEDEELQEMVKKVCARHETINARLKSFKILSTPYRNGDIRHGVTFKAIMNLVALQIQSEPQHTYQVHYNDFGLLLGDAELVAPDSDADVEDIMIVID